MLTHAENPQLINFLSLNDIQSLCLLSKKHAASYEHQRDLFVLLEATFQGNEAKVAAIITKKPALLMMARSWIDSANRAFESISVLQYSVWAHDADMVRTILEALFTCELELSEQIQTELIKQITYLRTGNLTHTKINTSIKSMVYDDVDAVKVLACEIKTLANTAANSIEEPPTVPDLYFTPDQYPALQACWIQLGKIFRESPVHVIQSYHVVQPSYYENVQKLGTQDLFKQESYHLFADENKLFSYLFNIRTSRSEPFYWAHDKSANHSWFGQKKERGLGYDIGISSPFYASHGRNSIYSPEILEIREYKWLKITQMLHSLIGYYLLLKLRAKEVDVFLEKLMQPIQDLQLFINTLPTRKNTSSQDDLPLFFEGPTFWQTKDAGTLHTEAQVVLNTRVSNKKCCVIS